MKLLDSIKQLFNRHRVLKSDPCDLFKADRVPIYTTKAIGLIKGLNIESVNQLTMHRPHELAALPEVGWGTVGYIGSCLARHGLRLKHD